MECHKNILFTVVALKPEGNPNKDDKDRYGDNICLSAYLNGSPKRISHLPFVQTQKTKVSAKAKCVNFITHNTNTSPHVTIPLQAARFAFIGLFTLRNCRKINGDSIA